MSLEHDPKYQLRTLSDAERAFKTLLSAPEDAEKLQEALGKVEHIRQELMAKLIPERVYINMRPVFASVAFTVPSLDADIPESPSYEPGNEEMVITLKNNGRYQRSIQGHNGLTGKDWNLRTDIETVAVFGQTYTGEELLTRKAELLQNFFNQMLGGEQNAGRMAAAIEAAGLRQGSYLYRAINSGDYSRLKREGTLCFSHLDPSANFESEQMYQDPRSQVRHYVTKTDEGYAGKIIRWQIEHPLLYRTAGMAVSRVIPLFSHFLPQVEISENQGQTFNPARVNGGQQ